MSSYFKIRAIIFPRRILTFSRTMLTRQLQEQLIVNSSLVPEKPRPYQTGGNDVGIDGGKKSSWASLRDNLLLVAISFGFTVVAGFGISMYNDLWDLLNSIDKTIKTGTRPEFHVYDEKNVKVDRTNTLNAIIDTFINTDGKSSNYFGYILGPTGAGKTQLIKEACCKSSEGALYFELTNHSLSVTSLAATLGIHIGHEPKFWEIIIKKYFNNFVGYYTLPDKKSDQIKYVFECFEKKAELYKAKTGRPPCVFIDGIELIAKSDKAIFETLVTTAKTLAERGNVRIVFGCSEGHIIPLIEEMSQVRIIDILDLPRKQGEEYLKKYQLPDSLAKRVIDHAGSRIIFLSHAVRVFRDCQKVGIQDENILFDEIIGTLHFPFLGRGLSSIACGWPLSIEILKDLQKCKNDSGLILSDYQEEHKNDWKVKREEALQELVRKDVLRYITQSPDDTTQSSGKTKQVHVVWSSKLMKKEVTTKWTLKQ